MLRNDDMRDSSGLLQRRNPDSETMSVLKRLARLVAGGALLSFALVAVLATAGRVRDACNTPTSPPARRAFAAEAWTRS
jgi:hypothetical protein